MEVIFSFYSFIMILIFLILWIIIFSENIMDVLLGFMLFCILNGLLIAGSVHEYFAYVYVLVYFGAVMVFFLFVVMLMEVTDFAFERM